MRILIAFALVAVTLAGCVGGDDTTIDAGAGGSNPGSNPGSETGYEPHVMVAIPDSGINPYHELYYRPDRTAEPCTYIEDMPCGLPALELSVGGDDWQEAFDADAEIWGNITPGVFYWIPQTVFVAVSSESCDGVCILDDTSMHGTGTTSSVIMENPDAVIAFKEGGSGIEAFAEAGLPVDIYSVSWGFIAPIPAPGPACVLEPEAYKGTMYIKASGNAPGVSTLTDCWSGKSGPITVGGAYAEDNTQEVLAFKEMDVVSYFCRPVAQTNVVSGLRDSYCGTSFSAPTVAGALSKVVLELRRSTDYTGGSVGEMMVPDLNISRDMIREALNQTASYDPESQYSNTGTAAIPLNPLAPYTQWGWGFYDALLANATVEHLLNDGGQLKSAEATSYQEAIYEGRKALYG